MSWATPRVGAEVEANVRPSERTPRLVIAVAAASAAALAPGALFKGLLFTGAAAMLATVVTGYCPINAALDEREANVGEWRDLRTFRVTP